MCLQQAGAPGQQTLQLSCEERAAREVAFHQDKAGLAAPFRTEYSDEQVGCMIAFTSRATCSSPRAPRRPGRRPHPRPCHLGALPQRIAAHGFPEHCLVITSWKGLGSRRCSGATVPGGGCGGGQQPDARCLLDPLCGALPSRSLPRLPLALLSRRRSGICALGCRPLGWCLMRLPARGLPTRTVLSATCLSSGSSTGPTTVFCTPCTIGSSWG